MQLGYRLIEESWERLIREIDAGIPTGVESNLKEDIRQEVCLAVLLEANQIDKCSPEEFWQRRDACRDKRKRADEDVSLIRRFPGFIKDVVKTVQRRHNAIAHKEVQQVAEFSRATPVCSSLLDPAEQAVLSDLANSALDKCNLAFNAIETLSPKQQKAIIYWPLVRLQKKGELRDDELQETVGNFLQNSTTNTIDQVKDYPMNNTTKSRFWRGREALRKKFPLIFRLFVIGCLTGAFWMIPVIEAFAKHGNC